MRSTLLPALLFILFGILGTYYFQYNTNPYLAVHEKKMNSRKGRIPKKDRMDLAWEQEVEMTRDPELGYVPRERLLDAWYYMRSLQQRLSKAAIPGIDWQERGPDNCGGRSRAVCVDLNDVSRKTIWVGSVAGGLWKTTDITAAAPQWTVINDFFQNLAITYITQAPTNPNVMYFCTGEGNNNSDAARGLGIWKSTNGGNSWTQLAATNNSNFHYCQKMLTVGNGDTVYVATRTGLYRSLNGGTAFTKVLGSGIAKAGGNVIYDIERAANGTLYCSTSSGSNGTGTLHKSYDKGTTWTDSLTLPSYLAKREIEIALSNVDTNIIWGLVENASRIQAIIKTTNAGLTWDTTASHPVDADPGIPGSGNPRKDFSRNQGWYDLSFAVDPNNPNVCFAGGIDLFKTSNGGGSWQQISHWYGGFGFQEVHADQHYVLFSPGSSSIVYFVNDGGIYRTQDATASIPTIESKEKNYRTTQFYACDIHPTAGMHFYLAGAQDNGSHRFNTAGINATVEVTGGDGAFCHIDQNQPQYQFTSYVYNNYYRSTNTGSSFSGVSYGDNGRFINPSDYDDSLNLMYAALSTNNYLRWNNPQSGSTFTPVRVPEITAQVSAVKVSPNVLRRVYFGSSNGRIVRVDSAHTDTVRNGTHLNNGVTGFTNYVSCIEVERGNENHILVTQSNYGVSNIWRTTNGGTNWVACDGNLPDMPVRWILLNPDKPWQALIATELGVWSTDSLKGGTTDWQPSNTGLANLRCTMLKMRVSDKQVVVSTHGRGLYTSSVFMPATADFTANRTLIYEGQGIQFTDISVKGTSYSWNFGDATTSTQRHPFKVYTTPGVYSVSLTINAGASSQTKTSYIHVLPYRPVPYTLTMGGNFDVNANDFASRSDNGTAFARGNSSTSGKNGVRSGSFAWVTGLSGNYVNNTTSYLYTPNFNFTASGNYTIRFYCKNVFEIGYDGFRVEYTLDTGTTWIPLSTTTSTGWYDFANTAGDAAFPQNQAFFNSTNSSYTLKSFTTSTLQGNGRIGFRIVFKSDGGVTAAGVAIDDFEITGPTNGVMPVNLLSFTGKRLSRENVQLHWVSASEVNFSHYEIERKFQWNDNFENLGSVPVTASASAIKTYTHLDDNTHVYATYYRLKLVDDDGTYRYSNTIEVGNNELPEVIRIIPVAHMSKSFRIWSVQQERVFAEVMSTNGQILISQQLQVGGLLNLNAYPTGVYLIRIKQTNGNVTVHKVLVQ